MSRRIRLDGYRALGALAVLSFHAYQFNRRPGGAWPLEGSYWHEVMLSTDLFVSLFFVLSGFLLGLPYVRSSLGDAKPRGARVFLLRRVVRIVPLYYLVVLLVWAISTPRLPGDWQDLVLHLTFTHVYSEHKIFYTDGPAWSLAVEVHFYLLLAVLGALAQRVCRRLETRRARLTVLLAGIGVLMAISMAYKLVAWLVWHSPSTDWPVWFGPLAKLDVFAVGMLLAVASAAGVELRSRAVRWLAVAAGGTVIVLTQVTRPGSGSPEPFVHICVAIGCALVISSTALTAGEQPRWLQWRPLAAVGVASYSLYLWHEPVLRVLHSAGLLPAKTEPLAFTVTAGLLIAVSVPVALVSYRIFERTSVLILAAFDGQGRPRDYYAGTTVAVPERSSR